MAEYMQCPSGAIYRQPCHAQTYLIDSSAQHSTCSTDNVGFFTLLAFEELPLRAIAFWVGSEHSGLLTSLLPMGVIKAIEIQGSPGVGVGRGMACVL